MCVIWPDYHRTSTNKPYIPIAYIKYLSKYKYAEAYNDSYTTQL